MVQVAAALLFAVAASLGITVILAMLRSNADAILSALLGEGAFPSPAAPGLASDGQAIKLRAAPVRHFGTHRSRTHSRSVTIVSRAA